MNLKTTVNVLAIFEMPNQHLNSKPKKAINVIKMVILLCSTLSKRVMKINRDILSHIFIKRIVNVKRERCMLIKCIPLLSKDPKKFGYQRSKSQIMIQVCLTT